MTIHTCTKPLRVAAIVLLAVTAAGCSSSSHQPQVASLPTTTTAIAPTVTRHATSVSTSANASNGSRPRERLEVPQGRGDSSYKESLDVREETEV